MPNHRKNRQDQKGVHRDHNRKQPVPLNADEQILKWQDQKERHGKGCMVFRPGLREPEEFS